MGVALWLCPKKNSGLSDKLSTLMGSLNTVFPGSPPRFDPHITISTNLAVDLDNPKDDVSKILSSCASALSVLPKSPQHEHWIRLGRVNSQRKYFQKLYFQVLEDPTLVSFARIVQEIFVLLPAKVDAEHKAKNPHLYHKDHSGNLVRRRPSTKSKKAEAPQEVEVDMRKLQQESAQQAAEWAVREYMPHLSLVYSDLHPIDNALWHTIRSRVSDYLGIDNCDSDEWNRTGNGISWDGGVLKLVLCEGDVNDWVVLGSVDV
ncbi:hypothetical protein SBP28_004065 [Candidozyma auris]